MTAFLLALAAVATAAGAPAGPAGSATLALVGGTVFTSPHDEPIADGVVLVRDGRIAAVGERDEVSLPPGTERIDCQNLFVTAAFQNSHVHFTDAQWADADSLPADLLATRLEDAFSRHGFTTVFETASFLENTLALRSRIESGDVPGPRILTAGYALYPRDGIPFYLRDSMGLDELARLRTPLDAAEAKRYVESNLEAGADAVKIFAVSWIGKGATQPMDETVAAAAVAAAHARGKPVFAHPSNSRGLEIALAAGADVLAHAVEDRRGWKTHFTAEMVAKQVAVVPTLMLFERDRFLWEILDGVGEFAREGGRVLFGTDAGFLPVYDPRDEYVLMAAAGLDPLAVLAALTSAPAAHFGEAQRRGRIAVGLDADLVVLGSDPRNSVLALTQVKTTLRAGRVLYDGPVPR